jgi:hypothetical protein
MFNKNLKAANAAGIAEEKRIDEVYEIKEIV